VKFGIETLPVSIVLATDLKDTGFCSLFHPFVIQKTFVEYSLISSYKFLSNTLRVFHC
jgi:hypothetical protein